MSVTKVASGVWRTPDHDRIGSRRFYAAKSMEDGAGRRYYFGWIPDRANKSEQNYIREALCAIVSCC